MAYFLLLSGLPWLEGCQRSRQLHRNQASWVPFYCTGMRVPLLTFLCIQSVLNLWTWGRGKDIQEFVYLVLVLNQELGVAGGFRCSSGGHLPCWDLRCDHHPSQHTDVPHDQEDKGSRCEDGPLRRGIGWDLRRLLVLPQGSQQGGVAPWDCAEGMYLHNTSFEMLCYVWLWDPCTILSLD